MFKSIRHTCLIVRDLDKSLKFYNKVGGKTVSQNYIYGDYPSQLLGALDVKLRYAKLQFGDDKCLLELIQFKNPKLHPRMSQAHIAFTVTNIDELVTKLLEDGIGFISTPIKAPDSNVKVCFCVDEDGNRIELVEELNEQK